MRSINSILELRDHAKRRTLQSVDSPCLKLVQRDLGRGRQNVEVEPMFIVVLFEFWFRELPFLVIEVCAPFRVHARIIVSDHGGGCGLFVATEL